MVQIYQPLDLFAKIIQRSQFGKRRRLARLLLDASLGSADFTQERTIADPRPQESKAQQETESTYPGEDAPAIQFDARIDGRRFRHGPVGQDDITTVSYTHLDVYKRQA